MKLTAQYAANSVSIPAVVDMTTNAVVVSIMLPACFDCNLGAHFIRRNRGQDWQQIQVH